jgi:hypothetical protein
LIRLFSRAALVLDEYLRIFSYDVVPVNYHPYVEQHLFFGKKMFVSDITNKGDGRDVVWNYPIYKTNMNYKEKTGENDVFIVSVMCKVSVWKSPTAEEKNYEYNIKYKSDGTLDATEEGTWITEIEKRPDSAWYPKKQTDISQFWKNQLNTTNINTITGR